MTIRALGNGVRANERLEIIFALAAYVLKYRHGILLFWEAILPQPPLALRSSRRGTSLSRGLVGGREEG